MRLRDGWVRIGLSRDRRCYVGTLEDREGVLRVARTQVEANVKALQMGRAICVALLRHNREYAVGEPTGRRDAVMVA